MSVDISQLKRYVALEIYFDPHTGWRAGGISPTDRGLICIGWQDLDKGIEIRLITDNRNIEQYRGIKGVTILEGIDTINKRIKELCPPRYSIVNPELLRISIEQKGIRIDDIDPTLPLEKQWEILYKRGALGIRKTEPFLLPKK